MACRPKQSVYVSCVACLVVAVPSPFWRVPSQLCERLVERLKEAHATSKKQLALPVHIGRTMFTDTNTTLSFGDL